MTAHDAMMSILDVNESLEDLKERNTSNTPDLRLCIVQNLLIQYRELLVAEMKATTLEVFNNENK